MLSSVVIRPSGTALCGEYTPPGDRRITHAALLLGALTEGPLQLQGALESPDTVATRRVLAHLGVCFSTDTEGWLNVSRLDGKLRAPDVELDCGASLDTMRLLAGLLAGQKLSATLTGDGSLLAQPFAELAGLLGKMGAEVECLGASGRPPLRIRGKPLRPLKVLLAQELAELREALLLAALAGVGESQIGVAATQADHLERLLKHLGARLQLSGQQTTLAGDQRLRGKRLKVAGDISAALPLMLCAALLPGSDVQVNHAGSNPSRMGLLKALGRAARIEREREWQYGSEPVSGFRVRAGAAPSTPPAFNIPPNLALTLLDDFPLAVLLASQAHGVSRLRGAAALRLHAPDLLVLTAQIARAFGADVETEDDGFTVHGPCRLAGAEVQCAGELRLSRLAVAASVLADGPSVLHGVEPQALDWLAPFGIDAPASDSCSAP